MAQLELIDPTHRGLHRFIPRHHDEVEIEIGDPIYVNKEAEDLWCEGRQNVYIQCLRLKANPRALFSPTISTPWLESSVQKNAKRCASGRNLKPLRYISTLFTTLHLFFL